MSQSLWEWETTLPDGRTVSVFQGPSVDVLRPTFVWQISGQPDYEPAALEREIDGGPARVFMLELVRQVSPGRWVYDPEQQNLDDAGEAARAWVDSLPVERLLELSRDL